jgi:hypothetical protein
LAAVLALLLGACSRGGGERSFLTSAVVIRVILRAQGVNGKRGGGMVRRRLPIALGATFVLMGGGVAAAATFITPPAGTPDLAAAVLQQADLPSGAMALQQGYVMPPAGFTAEYDGGFSPASTADGVQYTDIIDAIAVAPTAATANTFFLKQRKQFASTKGRKQITKEIVSDSARKDDIKPSDVKYSLAGNADIGSDSYGETITIKIKKKKLREVVLFYVYDDAYVSLVLDGLVGGAVPESDASSLGTTVLGHLQAVIGASGASGTTGAS